MVEENPCSGVYNNILGTYNMVEQSIKNNFKDYNFHKLYKELLNFCTLDLSSFYF